SLLGDGLKIGILSAMVVIHDGLTGMFATMLDPQFWDSFERKFQVLALGFGATLMDGVQKALGFQPPQEYWELSDEERRKAKPGDIISGYRDKNRFKEFRDSGQKELADKAQLAQNIMKALGDPHTALKNAKEKFAEDIAPLEAQRLHKLQQEQDRGRALRESSEVSPGAPFPELPPGFGEKDNNGRFPIRLFPGLKSLVKLQDRARIEGSDFGSDFKGTSTIGGATAKDFAKKSSVSLQDAVDFLFGESQFEDQKKSTDLQGKINAAMERIEKKDPVKVIKKLDPAFAG
ncbi:MAG: hypothetical protein ACTSU8_02150, partial [Alphaproteobacteria bacterium]